jgi:hypothetical protein
MDTTSGKTGEGMPPREWGSSRLWLVPLCGLLAWHCWAVSTLFGPQAPWESVLDDRPVVSGQHPLHLYHGYLGADSFLAHGRLSCYDPAFQAGYPKTPVFDGGSRPAELFLVLAGGKFSPSAYKMGLLISYLLAPLALALAARALGLNRRAMVLTVILGLLVWWGDPCRRALDAGDLDLLLAALAALIQAGLLVRFDRGPRVADWLGILLTGFLGWFAHPLLFALLLPLFLIYYLTVGARHHPIWSLLLVGGLLATLACNAFWLADWVSYWWLRVPLGPSEQRLLHRTPSTVWHAELWGEPVDRAVALFLLGAAVVGASILNQTGKRAAARLFGLGVLAFIGLAGAGLVTESFGRLSSPGLLVPGLLLAAPLAAQALEAIWRWLALSTARAWASCLLAAGMAAALVVLAPTEMATLGARTRGGPPLSLGLSATQERQVAIIKEHTSPSARILWEEIPRETADAGWTTLLPILTDRHFLGGLDPEGHIEHTAGGLSGQTLAGRLLSEWSNEALGDYCRRYNIGWVACRSTSAVKRFDGWPRARRQAPLGDDPESGWLFAIDRPHSFFLKGKGRWVKAELGRVALEDVQPEDGVVVLSLHYEEGMTVSPSRVKVELALDEEGRDPIPLVRLNVDDAVTRVTLTWGR